MSFEKIQIWVDLDNSPHVPFFIPIKRELTNRGYQVVFTARDCFQVCGLAKLFELEFKTIGKHYGKNKLLKVLGTLIRASQLLPYAIKTKPLLAVSHGSRSQLIASTLLGISSIEIFDYEYTQNLPMIKIGLGIAPQVIVESAKIKLIENFKYGICGYSGLKEDVYAESFKADSQVLKDLGISTDQLIVTIRPPATEAHYHNPESERLFVEAVNSVGSIKDSVMVILPRNEISQKQMIMDTWQEWYQVRKIIIPQQVVNGLDLIWHSDLVISGGGTMNREAAALDVPVYSIFKGKIGAVDTYLSRQKRLTLIESVADIKTKIKIKKRNKKLDYSFRNRTALKEIVDHIDEFAVNRMK